MEGPWQSYSATEVNGTHTYGDTRSSSFIYEFPLASQTKFSSSVRKPELESRLLCTGHRTANKQVSSVLFPEMAGNPGFDVIRVVFRCVVRGSFAFVSLIRT